MVEKQIVQIQGRCRDNRSKSLVPGEEGIFIEKHSRNRYGGKVGRKVGTNMHFGFG